MKGLYNWVNNRDRCSIINAVAIKHCISNEPKWAQKAKEELETYGISLTSGRINNCIKEIKDGLRKPTMPSLFGNEKKIKPRPEKDLIYAKVFLFCEVFGFDDYIGLPANQILELSRRFKNIVACENKKDMYEDMVKIRNFFIPHITKNVFIPLKSIEIINKDIFYFLNNTDKKFSIYDFDLMTKLNESDIKLIAEGVAKTSLREALINIVSVGARATTYEEYNENILPLFKPIFKKMGLEIGIHKSGTYKDRVHPMRYEIFVIENQNQRMGQ